MQKTITTLQFQKKDKNRVNIFLNGQYAFAIHINLALRLKKGQILSEIEISELKQADMVYRAYELALRYLSYRARSEHELQIYLEEKGYQPSIIKATISRLVEDDYLDDEAFARSWLTDRERLKPRGKRALRYELRQKGVTEAVINKVLVDLDEPTSAWRAIEPKLRQWQRLDQASFQKKLMGFLSRRGFDYEVCYQVYEQAWTDMSVDE